VSAPGLSQCFDWNRHAHPIVSRHRGWTLATPPDGSDQWEKELDEWLDSFLSIRFWMRKRSNAGTCIPISGNAGEDEDSLRPPVT